MSNQGYWNNNQSDPYQHHNQQQYGHGQGHDAYPPSYGQNQSYPSHQPSGYNQDNEPTNWGYGGGPPQHHQPPPQGHGQYDSHAPAPYGGQQFPPQGRYEHNQGYGQQYQSHTQSHEQYQSHSSYQGGGHSPQPPHYGAGPADHNRGTSQNPPYGGQHHDQGYGQGHQGYPGGAGQAYPEDPQQGAPGERGLLGAIGGAAAGGFAGGKMGHGVIGALGGAYAGHKLEDSLKEKKKKKHREHGQSSHGGHHRRRGSNSSSSSSSSSSSDDDRKHHHHGRYGNFSASSTQISLDRDFDLIASCATVHGTRKLSSISLNDCLTNSWGHLQWQRGGGFGASAKKVKLVEDGKVLEAELGDGSGGWNMSRICLDERITNNDGDLQFLT